VAVAVGLQPLLVVMVALELLQVAVVEMETLT
jgi:hypothetical protein